MAVALCFMSGCGRSGDDATRNDSASVQFRSDAATPPDDDPAVADGTPATPAVPRTYEVTADDLRQSRLESDRAAEGWVRLFDGHTLFGWEIAGGSDWRVRDGSIVADGGTPGLLCTSVDWSDFELSLQYRCDDATNSGVFLRTPLEPQDVATDCYEINIAPVDDPFPTGSVVKRQKRTETPPNDDATDSSDDSGDGWHALTATIDGGTLEVRIDGVTTSRLEGPATVTTGRIGLQYRRGAIEFRDVQLRPLNLRSLIDPELSQWKRYPDMSGEFRYDDGIVVDGGKTQLETRDTFGDFVMVARYRLAADDTNTGIFFRSIPGDEMMGYECQVNDAIADGNPLTPADCGTGGIFRRQDARVIIGRPDTFNTVVLNASGLRMAGWVDGVQVSNWYDDRKPDENPRRGSRTDAGTIIIQGHDPETAATFSEFKVQTR